MSKWSKIVLCLALMFGALAVIAQQSAAQPDTAAAPADTVKAAESPTAPVDGKNSTARENSPENAGENPDKGRSNVNDGKAPSDGAAADGVAPPSTPGAPTANKEAAAGEPVDAGTDAKAQPKSEVKPVATPKKVNLMELKSKSAEYATSWAERAQSLLGMVVLLMCCWFFSTNKKNVPWRIIGWGIGLQLILGVIVLKTNFGYWLFDKVNALFVSLMAFTTEGSSFIFGNLAKVNNVPVGGGGAFGPVGGSGQVAEVGAFFAFNVLPTIIFFSSLMAVLYHLGVMQFIVRIVAVVMQKTMGTSGSETLSASGNIFVGQTEAPLLVRPFVKGMTQSELMAVMTGGFATVAGGVMAAYVSFLEGSFSGIAGHLLSASVMSAPAALVCAKLMIPEDKPEESETYGAVTVNLEKVDTNIIDAAARGAGDGLKLALNVAAMLLAFIALIALANSVIGWIGGFFGAEKLTLELILGYLMAPFAWLMGVPWVDAVAVGELLGIKTVVNEFVAYMGLAGQLQSGAIEHPRSMIIAIYALCGFANFGSIAIQIGGIGGIAPSRRQDLAKLGLRAMIAGTIACMITATVAGLLV